MAERAVLPRARGAEEHDRVVNPMSPERVERLEVFGEDAQRTALLASEELGVLIR
jgi:hypothetical protein